MFRDYIVMDLDVVVPGDMGRGMGIPIHNYFNHSE